MADAETGGGRLCLETITIVQERDGEAQSQADIVQRCVCGQGGGMDMRDAKELIEAGPGPC